MSTNNTTVTHSIKAVPPNPVQALPSDLPTLVRTTNGILLRPQDDLFAFLTTDLNIIRLDVMTKRGLWLAGRIGNIRPLHRQRVLGRRFVITEHLDLHLLWHDDILFVKPLPSYLLDDAFFQTYVAGDAKLADAANGLLLSYASLIRHRSDFNIAQNERLIPASMDWTDWQALFDTKLYNLLERFRAGYVTCSPRFYFGELRMSRIDYIYRFHPAYRFRYLTRGYCTMPATYQSFLSRNFAWLLAVFAYLTTILTAMQVGLGTNQLRNNAGFNSACYGFTVFSTILPAVALVAGVLISVALTFYHVSATRQHLRTAAHGLEK